MDIPDSPAAVATPGGDAVGERSIRGGTLTVGIQLLSQAMTVVSVATLARLLTPQDYGSVAMVTAWTGFLNLFREFGLSGATIQKPRISHDEVSSLFFINVGLGALITATTIASAPLVAWFYGKPHLIALTVGLSLGSLVSSLGTQHAALLNRQMRFGIIAIVQLTSLAAGFAAALTVALRGGGYWALVANNVGAAAWSSAGFWMVSNFRPTRPRTAAGVRQLVRFGASIAGFDAATYFRENVDKVLIGRVWDAQSLGLYEKAVALLALPFATLRYPLNKVAFPAMSALAPEPARYRSYFVKYCSLLAFVSMPLVAFVFACAEAIISVLLGERWMGAVGLFRTLALAGFIETVGTLRTTVILSSGHGGRLLRWGLLNAAATVVAVLLGIRWGAQGVALAYSLSTYVVFHPLLVLAFHGTPVRTVDFYRAVARPAVASVAMLTLASLLVASRARAQGLLVIVVALPVCAVVYLGFYSVLPGGTADLRDYWGYLRVLLRRRDTEVARS